MDRPLGTPAKTLDQALIEFARSRQGTLDALALLGSLAGVTRKSLIIKEEAQRAAEAASLPPAPASAPAAQTRTHIIPSGTMENATRERPESPGVYRTAKSEYLPALEDRSVIEALIDFQKATGASARVQPAPSGFEIAELPQVAAKPKNTDFRKSPGIYQPILRPTTRPND